MGSIVRIPSFPFRRLLFLHRTRKAESTTPDWSNRGGIVGRGVLLDYVAYADRKGIKYDPMSRHEITVADLDAIIADEKLTLRAGDVLIVRSGWVKWYNEASEEQRLAKVKNGHEHCGVKACEETMRWLWDHHFAAIAGDQVAFEAWPPQPPWSEFSVSPRFPLRWKPGCKRVHYSLAGC